MQSDHLSVLSNPNGVTTADDSQQLGSVGWFNENFNNFNWIPVWFVNHFPKILETYAIYFVLLLSPPIIYKFLKSRKKSQSSFAANKDLYELAADNPYLIFSLISIFSNVI